MISSPTPITHIGKKHVTASTLNDVVEHVVNSKEYITIIQTIVKCEAWKEVLQEISLWYLTKANLDNIRRMLISGEFRFYFTQSIKKQWHSNTSSFYRDFRKEFYNTEYQAEKHDIEFIDPASIINKQYTEEWQLMHYPAILEPFPWYQKQIWHMHVTSGMTLKSIVKHLNANAKSEKEETSITSIHTIIQNIRKEMKQKLKK